MLWWNTMTTGKLESKGFIWLILPHDCSLKKEKSKQELKPGRNQETGTDAEAMEGRCLLTCSLCLSQPAFLQNPGPPAQGWHHPQSTGPSPHQSLIKKMPHRLSYTAWSYGNIFSTEAPSFQITLACVKLTQHQPGQCLSRCFQDHTDPWPKLVSWDSSLSAWCPQSCQWQQLSAPRDVLPSLSHSSSSLKGARDLSCTSGLWLPLSEI